MENLEVKEVVQNKNENNLKNKQTNVITIVLVCILVPVIIVAAVAIALLGNNDENKPQYHNLNEKILFEGLEFTFLEYEAKSYYVNPITANTSYPDNENNLLCSISLKLYNPTNSKINLTDSSFLSSNHRFMFVFSWK